MRMTSPALAFLVVACAWLPLDAQEPSVQERVDAVFAGLDSTRSPGCAISVVKGGDVVLARGYGMANLDHGVPIRSDTVFHVASVSKEFTAAAIALLALDGALSLDDTVQQHLPWVPEFEYPITIRNLVHHNSGLRDQWELLNMAGWRYSEDLITNDDVEYMIRLQRDLNFPPGDRYLYSNTGYTLMGMIVEAVSGQTLRDFTSERIFEPLGMTRTHFRDDFSEIVEGQAYGYDGDLADGGFGLSVTNFDTVGATSLLTTVEDMARWDRNFIDPVVGGPDFLDMIHQRGRLNSAEAQDYAFGLVHGTHRGLPTVGHGGADAGYRSRFVRFPEQGYSFVVLCNLAQAEPASLALQVAGIYLEDYLEPAAETVVAGADAVPLGEQEAARLEGAYWYEEEGAVVRVARGDDGLQLSLVGQQAGLLHLGDGRFYARDIDVMARFEPADGAVEQMTFWAVGDEQDIETAKRMEAPDESLAADDFTGTYASPELPVTYHVEHGDKGLMIRWLKVAPSVLSLVARDTMVDEQERTLRFRRDTEGKVVGFSMDAGRIRNFRFERLK